MTAFEQALSEQFRTEKNIVFEVKTNIGDFEEYSAAYFYRAYKDMPELEKLALANVKGQILDVGSGTGCHSLYLQSKQHEVISLELSAELCSLQKELGILSVVNDNFYRYQDQKFDTLLFLMNGLGMAESLTGLEELLFKSKSLLKEKGQIILDSADITYLFEDEDDKQAYAELVNYYGEIEYQVSYKDNHDQPFKWLFVDYLTLEIVAKKMGYYSRLIKQLDTGAYLAILQLIG